jgi:alanine racemase
MEHKLYTVQEIKKITGAKATVANPDAVIRTLGTDSRKLTDVIRTLFFALKGRRDGHEYLKEIYDLGVRNFVITDKALDTNSFKDANFFLVKDSLRALQSLGAYHRRQYNYPVIAITGSNGKTIVKEWLYQLVAPEYNVVRSPKSYNSQIGVPLSVWQMNEEHTLGIFETGISKAGEMEALENVIKPTIGILTTIGEAHNEGFESRESKITEKLLLFKDADIFVYSPKHLLGYSGDIPGKEKFT